MQDFERCVHAPLGGVMQPSPLNSRGETSVADEISMYFAL